MNKANKWEFGYSSPMRDVLGGDSTPRDDMWSWNNTNTREKMRAWRSGVLLQQEAGHKHLISPECRAFTDEIQSDHSNVFVPQLSLVEQSARI